MSSQIIQLKDKIILGLERLKPGTDVNIKNEVEYDLNYLNIHLAELESAMENEGEQLEVDMNRKFLEIRDNYKSDSRAKAQVDLLFCDPIITYKANKILVKEFNRIHKGFIRLADHLTGRVIQENVDAKRSGY